MSVYSVLCTEYNIYGQPVYNLMYGLRYVFGSANLAKSKNVYGKWWFSFVREMAALEQK